MSPWWQAFLLGAMVAWTPSLLIFCILLTRAPDLRRKEAETPLTTGFRPRSGPRPLPPTGGSGVRRRPF
jgi:hypothetical protein